MREKAKRAGAATKPKPKNDLMHVAAARELRDRWLEEVNAGRYLPAANGKYDVSRAIEGPATFVPVAVIEQHRPALPPAQAA